MYKREFIKTLGLGSLGLAAGHLVPPLHFLFADDRDNRRKYWTWVTTDVAPSADEWKD